MLFAVVFLKAPIYALGFLFCFLLYVASWFLGNGLYGLLGLIFSCYFWCLVSLIEYIADKETNTSLMGYDLKKIVPVSRVFLGLIFVNLFLGWFLILSNKAASDLTIFFIILIFVSVPSLIIGTIFIRTMIVLGVAKHMDGNISIDSQRLLKDIIRLLAQK